VEDETTKQITLLFTIFVNFFLSVASAVKHYEDRELFVVLGGSAFFAFLMFLIFVVIISKLKKHEEELSSITTYSFIINALAGTFSSFMLAFENRDLIQIILIFIFYGLYIISSIGLLINQFGKIKKKIRI